MQESTITQDNSNSRPALLGLTRATTNLIYQGIVASQATNLPQAALYGVKYLTPEKELSFVSPATYSGQYGLKDRKSMTEVTVANMGTVTKGELFIVSKTVFKAIKDTPFTGITATDINDALLEAIANETIRIAPEAAITEKFEASEPDIAESGFIVNKWQADVKSRKFKTELTVELAQDMEAVGFDAPAFLEDLLATQMAEEINKDIIQSLTTVSKRFKTEGKLSKGIFDLSTISVAVEQARELYRYICEMNAIIQKETAYSATYVVATARVAAVLASSGWLKKEPNQQASVYGVLENGLIVYVDTTSNVDYVVVGVKADYGSNEMVGSLFYAPYIETKSQESDDVDHVGAYKIINDPDSLQPKIALLVRYALCVNPYTMGLTDQEARVIDSTNLDNFVGQSKMSMILGIKLPKLV